MHDGVGDPHPEDAVVEVLGPLGGLVEGRVAHAGVGVAVLVEQPHGDGRARGEEDVVQSYRDKAALNQTIVNTEKLETKKSAPGELPLPVPSQSRKGQ